MKVIKLYTIKYIAMKKVIFIFSVFFIAVLCMGKINAQIMPTITKVALLEHDKVTINQRINEYTTFTMDKRALVDSLQKYGRCQFQFRIDERLDWILDLQFNDMRAPDYKQTYISDEGKFEYKPFVLNTYKGKTSNDQIARFSIDENNFFGVILDNEYHYVIRLVRDFIKNSSDERLIVYKSSDILENETFDYINDALIAPDGIGNIEENVIRGNTPCPYYLKIATDTDYEFYQAKGSNLARTYSDIFSVLNIVEGVYESTFKTTFIITHQNVWTTTSSGYAYTSTNYSVLLDQFRNYWNSNMKNVSRNIAHLFTGKDIGVWGVAWLGQVCNPKVPISPSYAYAISWLRLDMYQTTAHEIGHNLNATDNPSNCSCGTSSASVMCQGIKAANLWFCHPSINQISPFLVSKRTLLTGNFPNTLTLTGTVSGFNVYQAIQKITSNQVINSGYTVYKAAEVELGNNFEVKLGAEFEIIIDDNGCP